MSKFIRQLEAAWAANDSLLCVGIDPDLARIPAVLKDKPHAILEFGRAIVGLVQATQADTPIGRERLVGHAPGAAGFARSRC